MPKISVIVPIYNAERFIPRCLESICSQLFKDFEVILVDDGSTDKCGAICDEYTAKDTRFKVIHQTNGGVSVARQVGLDAATGDYVIHADPDDWVEQDWLQDLYDSIKSEDADMAICSIDKRNGHRIVIYRENPFADERRDIVWQLLAGKLWGGCINKLVRRELFSKYNIRFIPNMTMWEDLYVSCRLLMNPVKVTYVPKVLYHYDFSTNMDSLCKKMDERRVESAKLFVNLLEPQLPSGEYSDLFFKRKTVVKRWAMRAGYRGCRLIELFPEINERLIKDAKVAHVWSEEYCLSMFLKGSTVMGTWLYQLAKVANKVKRMGH